MAYHLTVPPQIGAQMYYNSIGRTRRTFVTGLTTVLVTALLCAGTAMAQSNSSSKPASTAPHHEYTKPSDAELHKKLTKLQYNVTQHEATETPFNNQYWDNHEDGIYVDIVSGEPLFSSLDKFESGTGWPSFTKPLEPANIRTKTDRLLGFARTEVRSAHANSHLGHVFDDGPRPTGLRYCMNSASLRFIPVSQLETEGYGEYAALFKAKAAAKTSK